MIKDFTNSYKMLCDKMYLVDGYSYTERIKISGKCPELVRSDLLELKKQIDSRMLGYIRQIEKHLNIKEYE